MEVEPGDVPLEKGFGEQEVTEDRRLNIVQTQGKSNRAPIAEYQEKIDAFIRDTNDRGWDMEEGPSEPDYDNAEDVEDWNNTTTYNAADPVELEAAYDSITDHYA
jgi:hypothetical protein